MTRTLSWVGSCVILISANMPSPSDLNAQALPVPQVYAEKTNWHWAAVSQAVLAYYGTTMTQSDIAVYGTPGADNAENALFGRSSACPKCNAVDKILTNFNSAISANGVYGSLEWEYIYNLINKERSPSPIQWEFATKRRIVVIKDAFYCVRRVPCLTVMDPLEKGNGTYTLKYKEVVDDGDHLWMRSLDLKGQNPKHIDPAD